MTLVEKLDHYWETHEAKEYPGEPGLWFDTYADDEGCDLIDTCWKELIRGNWWNSETKAILQEHGYSCWAGDRDSFGLLVAVVTKDGKSISIG